MAPPVTGSVAPTRYTFRRSAWILVGGIILGALGGILRAQAAQGVVNWSAEGGTWISYPGKPLATVGFIVAVIGLVMVLIGIYRAASNIDLVAQHTYDKQLRRQLCDEAIEPASRSHDM